MAKYMQLSEQDIEEFRTLYLQDGGQQLTKKQAADYAGRFLCMMEILYTPITNREMEEMQQEVRRIRLSRYGVED
jgi:hypothetical protein